MIEKNSKENLSNSIFLILKERIINWEYLPNHRFTEVELSEEFNVSRSPIREALYMLEDNQLIKKEPKHKYIVNQPNLKEIKELYAFRLALELYVVEYLAESGKVQSKLEKLYDQWFNFMVNGIDDFSRMAEIDETFHKELIKSMDNSYLFEKYLEVIERIHFIRMTDITTIPRFKTTAKQHLQLIECIQNKDVIGAKESIKININDGLKNVDNKLNLALSKAFIKTEERNERLKKQNEQSES